jgi:hypothetical protein
MKSGNVTFSSEIKTRFGFAESGAPGLIYTPGAGI